MRVLVVDDSTLYRKVVRDALASLPGVEIVGVAADGEAALIKIEELKPDLVTLDVEMPILDGLGVLERLSERPKRPTVVMVSSLSGSAANATAKALRLGAFDLIVKPSHGSLEENQDALVAALKPIAAELVEQGKRSRPLPPVPSITSAASGCSTERRSYNAMPPQAVVIGVSTGGPSALGELLPQLPSDFPLPILIVQHMPAVFTKSLAEQLDRLCELTVHEAVHGQICRPGEVYIAPGGTQMKIARVGHVLQVQVTDDPPEQSCRPSVNYLFRSTTEQLNGRVLGVILTGMGNDGLEASFQLKQAGGTLMAQSEATCTVYGMPRAVAEAGLVDCVLPLGELAGAMTSFVRGGTVLCS